MRYFKIKESTKKIASILSIAIFIILFCNNNVFAAGIDLLGTDTTNPQQIVVRYISMFGGVSIALGLTLVGFRMILSSNKTEIREETMKSLGKVIVGSIIIGSSLLLAGFLINLTNNMGGAIDSNLANIETNFSNNIDDKEGNFIIKGLAEIISGLAETVFTWFGSLAGFLPLNELLFNDKTPFGITGNYSIPPFTEVEWQNLNYIYVAVCSICAPFVLIMIAKTGFKLLFSTISPSKRSELYEDILRWFFSAAIIATAPILVKGLFLFCNHMTSSLATMFKSRIPEKSFAFDHNLMNDIKTGNILSTAIVKFLYAWKYVEINLVFLSRKVILVVMYAFTPIAALLWGINNKVQASQIWFGEMITNASMQFFFAFTFSVMILSLGTATWSSWLYSLIWMFALIKIADVLRNSLQGFFTRMAGIDESQLGNKALGSIGGMVAGASMAFGHSIKGNGLGNALNMSSIKEKAFGNVFSSNGKFNSASSIAGTATTGSNNMNLNGKNMSSDIKTPFENNKKSNPTINTTNPNISSIDSSDLKSEDANNTNFSEMNTDTPNFTSDSTDSKSTINPNNFSGLSSIGDVVDKQGTVNMENLKEKSNRQFMYNSLLNDNIKKHKGNSKWNNAGKAISNIARASTGFNPAFEGFASGIENAISGMNDRKVVGSAINDTVQQIQEMSGISAYEVNEKGEKKPVYNMNKQQALKNLFGGSNELQTRFKQMSFKNAIVKGNSNKAEQILANSNTFQSDLSDKQRNVIIAKTNPYTSVDGFRWN